MYVYCEDGFKELSHKNVVWLNLFELERVSSFVKRNNDKSTRFYEDALDFVIKFLVMQCSDLVTKCFT